MKSTIMGDLVIHRFEDGKIRVTFSIGDNTIQNILPGDSTEGLDVCVILPTADRTTLDRLEYDALIRAGELIDERTTELRGKL